MNGRIVLLAASLALVAGAGCQTNKKKTTAKADTATAQQEPERMEQVGEDVAEATRDAADDTLQETERAQERLNPGETLPPEPGVDMPEMGEETPDPDANEGTTLGEAGAAADKRADDAAAEVNETADDAMAKMDREADETKEQIEETAGDIEDTADAADGKFVTARVDTVNRTDERVRFRIEEDLDEIQLQSGKEIDVPFGDLTLFTGLSRADLLEKLEQGSEVKVKVIGAGDAMRIVDVELQSGTEKKHDDMEHEKKTEDVRPY